MNKRDVIVACDFKDKDTTLRFLELFDRDEKPFVKIGMELFYSEGPDIVKALRAKGHDIFLDLKLHDIPNTVKSAMKVISRLDVQITNIHASTDEMMKEALEGLRENDSKTLLITVTILTSTGSESLKKELLIDYSLDDVIKKYALRAFNAGLDGVVCSPKETALVKETCGSSFIIVTPGIRYPDSLADDQSRVTTPKEAGEIGCDYIVVGRPITRAKDPISAYRKVRKEFLGG